VRLDTLLPDARTRGPLLLAFGAQAATVALMAAHGFDRPVGEWHYAFTAAFFAVFVTYLRAWQRVVSALQRAEEKGGARVYVNGAAAALYIAVLALLLDALVLWALLAEFRRLGTAG
jgi:hypothetical protein